MKYKRQLMASAIALTIWAGGSSIGVEDFGMSNSKIEQSYNQIRMKSNSGEKISIKSKKVGIKNSLKNSLS